MRSCTPTFFKNKKWNFTSLHELHGAANLLLRQAILNERYKRWRKVIESYKELIWLISLDHFPDDYEPPSSYAMLLYELHFHLGVAYQQLNKHDQAVEHFSKTIEVVSIAKNGCLAGCLTNSCLMTPIYTRRAFANAMLNDYKCALKDAEKAVVLDSKSPDVYCIRALVRSTFDDELYGLKDLEMALTYNPDHICATMLKASFTKPLVTDENENFGFFGKFSGEFSKKQTEYEKLRQKAIRLNQEAETYLTCNSFTHPCILEFYDKFLFPLSVPHTMTSINLSPEKPSKKHLESDAKHKAPETKRPISAVTEYLSPPSVTEVFRCGTPSVAENNRMNLKRRTDYSNSIREYMARPTSAAEYFNLLEKQRRRDTQVKRAQSALIRPGQRFAARPPSSEVSSVLAARPATACSPMATFENKLHGHSTPKARLELIVKEAQIKETSNKKKMVIDTPSNYSIPVFQEVNIKFAPRMYYRPWNGDKLPSAERVPVKFRPAFY